MGTYVVRLVNRDGTFCGIVSHVASGRRASFSDTPGLLAAFALGESMGDNPETDIAASPRHPPDERGTWQDA